MVFIAMVPVTYYVMSVLSIVFIGLANEAYLAIEIPLTPILVGA